MARASTTAPEATAPETVFLARPYAFYDEEGKLRQWAEGEEVKDADDIKLLTERKAPLAGITHEEK